MRAIVTIGPSASGKTHWAEQFVRDNDGWVNINRDDIRFSHFCYGQRDWYKYKFNKTNEQMVTLIQEQEIDLAVKNRLNIIISDTNLSLKYRQKLINLFEKGYGYTVEVKEFDCDLETLFKRDQLRANGVGREVIYRQYLQWLEYKGFKKYKSNPTLEPCVICDIDGTIAAKSNRSPFDWNRVDEDLPIKDVINLVIGLYEQGYNVVFLSGRDAVCFDKTKAWLERYFQFPIELYMRPEGDCRKDYIIKRELFDKYVANEYNCCMVIDDRRQVIESCWGPLGIKTIDVGNVMERF